MNAKEYGNRRSIFYARSRFKESRLSMTRGQLAGMLEEAFAAGQLELQAPLLPLPGYRPPVALAGATKAQVKRVKELAKLLLLSRRTR